MGTVQTAARAVFTSSEIYFRITPLIITLETQSAKCQNIQLWLIEEGQSRKKRESQ